MATAEKVPMLAEGHRKLTEDLKRLKSERPEIVEAIQPVVYRPEAAEVDF